MGPARADGLAGAGAARPARRRLSGGILAGSVVAGLGLVAVLGTGFPAPAPAAPPAPQPLPVTGTVRVCPNLSAPAGGTGVLAAAMPPLSAALAGASASPGAGAASPSASASPSAVAGASPSSLAPPAPTATTAAPTGPARSAGPSPATPAPSTLAVRLLGTPAAAPVAALPGAGAVTARFTGTAGAALVTGVGPGAAAAGVLQADRTDTGTARGLAVTACSDPGTDLWFVGAVTTVGALSQLVLTNPDTTQAVVDVAALTPDGLVASNAGSGLPVAAGAQFTLPLDALAPQAAVLAVHVQARAGRVSGALAVARAAVSTPLGDDWLPAAAPPATSSVVPGLPAGSGQRQVILANPGSDPATVTVRLVTDEASFVPQGLQSLAVPAGSAVAVDVTAALAGHPGAAQVTADTPVLAGAVAASGDGRGPTDVGFTAATAPLSAPAVVPDVMLVAPAEEPVLLTVADGNGAAGRLGVSVLAADGSVTEQLPVSVPPGRTVVLARPASAPAGSALVLTPEPTSGPVVAAVTILTAPVAGAPGLISMLPLVGRSGTVSAPPVVADPLTGVGDLQPSPAATPSTAATPTPSGSSPSGSPSVPASPAPSGGH